MPFYQCPRCGGSNSYGQWEQRLNNNGNLSVRDNRGHQVGNVSGGFNVQNVRQQYCSSCVSVKMDLKFSAQDWKGLRTLVIAFGCFGALALAFQHFQDLSSKAIGSGYGSTIRQHAPTFYVVDLAISLLSLFAVYSVRRIRIRNQDKAFLRDRFYKPKPLPSAAKHYGLVIALIVIINAILVI